MLNISVLFISLIITFNIFAICDFPNDKCNVNPKFKKYLLKRFKGIGPAPKKDPVNGIKYIETNEAIKLVNNNNYIFIDNRPANYHEKCKIKNSVNYLYGVPSTKNNTFTKKIAKKIVAKGKTLVFYCNSLKCYRSLNAAVQSFAWGIPKNKIKWFGKGILGIANTADYNKYLKGKECKAYKK